MKTPKNPLLPATLLVLAALASTAHSAVLLRDEFNTSAGSEDVNFDINDSGRQTGSLAGTLYRQGHGNYGTTINGATTNEAANGYLTQVNNEGTAPTLWLVGNAGASKIASISPESNFNQNPGLGGYMSIKFSLNPDTGDTTSDSWGAITVGSSDNAAFGASGSGARGQFINDGAAHFGILVRDNGGYQAFDGGSGFASGDLTTTFLGTSTLELRIYDAVDGNPWDGVNGTTIDVYFNGAEDPFVSHTKGGGGYTDNFITLQGYSDGFNIHEFDNLEIAIVPEPSSLVLLGGAFCTAALRRKRRS